MIFSKLLPVASQNKVMPILENFKIESVNGDMVVSVTDLGVYVVAKTGIKYSHNEPILVNASRFASLFNSLGGDSSVGIDVKDSVMVLKKGKSSYKLPVLSTDGFPDVWVLPDSIKSVSIHNLTNVIDKTVWCASRDELRPSMTGVYFDGSNAVATDAHKLVKIGFGRKLSNDSVIIPTKSLNVVKSLLNESCDVKIGDKKALFEDLGVKVYTNLIDEKYPNYEAVIPQHFTGSVSINRKVLLDAVNRLLLSSDPNTHRITLDFTSQEGSLLISSSDDVMGLNGMEEIECKFEGDALRIGLNGRFLVDALKTFSAELIELQFITPDKAMIVKVSDEHIILLMPVLIQ